VHRVLHEIQLAAAHCEQLPFFEFLGTQSIAPIDRLAFVPCMASFAMCLDDIDDLIAHDTAGLSPVWQRNWAGAESGQQWQRYLHDLAVLGFGGSTSVTRVLSEVAGHDRRLGRMWMARVAQLVHCASRAQRLSVAQALEVALNLLFSHASEVAAEMSQPDSIPLQFLGHRKFVLRATTKLRPAGPGDLEAIELGMGESRRCEELAFLVFDYFADWINEMLAGTMGALASHRAMRSRVGGSPWRRAVNNLIGVSLPVADVDSGAKSPWQ
jgi:hypothetical protein